MSKRKKAPYSEGSITGDDTESKKLKTIPEKEELAYKELSKEEKSHLLLDDEFNSRSKEDKEKYCSGWFGPTASHDCTTCINKDEWNPIVVKRFYTSLTHRDVDKTYICYNCAVQLSAFMAPFDSFSLVERFILQRAWMEHNSKYKELDRRLKHDVNIESSEWNKTLRFAPHDKLIKTVMKVSSMAQKRKCSVFLDRISDTLDKMEDKMKDHC